MKKKIVLSEIKVKSFVTSIKESKINMILGGGTQNGCPSGKDPDCVPDPNDPDDGNTTSPPVISANCTGVPGKC